MTKAIFIGATGQNVGKTTICLGIMSGLQKFFDPVGFIKPVGQRHVQAGGVSVDKDVVLFKEYFNLKGDWSDMSPVLIPSGFTRQYLDDEVTNTTLHAQIAQSFETIHATNSFTIVEGTGHVGVGSIIDLNNARVAASLGLDMVIIVSAGLGSTIDELALNVALCRDHNVSIRGIIVNRVQKDKRNMILEYLPKALRKWNIPLIGAVPFDPFLSTPTMKDFETLLQTPLLAGTTHRLRHFEDTRLVAGSLDSYHDEVLPNQLVITPASREEIIRAVLQHHDDAARDGEELRGGIVLTGRRTPSPAILDLIRAHDVPTLYAPIPSYEVMIQITSFIAKTAKDDLPKVREAIDVVERHIDFDALTTGRI